jgi:peptide chain release factor 2
MNSGGRFDIPAKQQRIAVLEDQMSAPDFWIDREQAARVMTESTKLKDEIEAIESVTGLVEEQKVLLDLIMEAVAVDGMTEEEVLPLSKELTSGLRKLNETMKRLDLQHMLNGPFDRNNAIMEIHSGAGGTESQDWAEMLMRMYMRWATDKGFKVDIISIQAGDSAGIKSATLLFNGAYTYGLLKSEQGVHRLVRISPFDSSARRHTSFASVDVMPEFVGEISIEIKAEDLKIDTYRAGGAGGQHVNTTDSAVRITHLPTGVVVTCQAERSQLQNKERALTMLKGKLYERQLAEQAAAAASVRGEQKEIGWGSQVRSYVFQPYQMIKDHRTNVEVGNVDAVMDGEIDQFIDAYLRSKIGK